MERDSFTAGIEPGGLTSSFEIRMLICWLIDRMSMPMTITQLSSSLLNEGLVNYFELVTNADKLIKSGHLVETASDTGHESALSVTELGKKAAAAFEKEIPLSVREKALASAQHTVMYEKLKRENHFEAVPLEDGFRITLSIGDIKGDLLSLSMYVPTREHCRAIEKRFLNDPTKIYRAVVETLFDEKFGAR